MESINKLREWVNGLKGAWIDIKDNSFIFTTGDDAPPSMSSVNLREHLNGILDSVVREVEEHYVPLPVDADGECIHVGDSMEMDDGTTFEVEQISLYEWGWRCDGYEIDWSGSIACTVHANPDRCCHYAPTVEDVLREMLYKSHIYDKREMELLPGLITEYAAKLRLAGDGE